MTLIPFLLVTAVFLSGSHSISTRAISDEICCSDLNNECFNDNAPWTGFPLPQCPCDMDVTMILYTCNDTTDGSTITSDNLPPNFNGQYKTAWITHGWFGNISNPWLANIKDALLAQGEYCNVIIVGWGGGADDPDYLQSASNTRTVGAAIALVVNNLINNTESDNYCVGHSLGSHVCGQAGQRSKFSRITGLDPAGPFFEDRNWTCGLNPSCADFVDVIHTDGGSSILGPTNVAHFGTLKVLGDVDFYPNGGGNQPGCPPDTLQDLMQLAIGLESIQLTEQNVASSVACNHYRAIWYYLESILTPCFLSRNECTDPENLPASCETPSSNSIQSVGLAANTFVARGIFYLQTGSDNPYCLESF